MEPDWILFDGHCGLCHGAVRFVLRHDSRGRFKFLALESPLGREVLSRHGEDPRQLDTFFVLRRSSGAETLLDRSTAALYVLGRLGGVFRLSAPLSWIPRRLRDWAYDRVARVRYRIFGRFAHCPLPRPEFRARFIDGADHGHPPTPG